MSAKPAKKSAKREPARAQDPVARATTALAAPAPATGAGTSQSSPAWIDSTDPRKRLMGKFVLVGIWIYVAALWLLALDQTFNWGIFGPKSPPLP